MFKNYFKGIEGIANYPMFSLLIFFFFFTAITIWMIRADKKKLEEISKLPLVDNNKSSNS